MGMIIPGHKLCSNCRTMYPRDIGYCPYCKKENKQKNKTMLTEKEVEQLWEITNRGIDLEDIVKICDEMYEMMKPVFDLYAKNVKTYLKFKEGK